MKKKSFTAILFFNFLIKIHFSPIFILFYLFDFLKFEIKLNINLIKLTYMLMNL
jgi:hypothetical protein